MDGTLIVLSRWIHVISAAVAIGGVVFMRIILPLGIRTLAPESQSEVINGVRAIFKRVIHTAILLLLLSGIYNTIQNWDAYKLNRAVMHGLWGTHLLLGLVVFTIAFIALAGKTHTPRGKMLMAVNIGLLMIVVALASTLKFARDRAVRAGNVGDVQIQSNLDARIARESATK